MRMSASVLSKSRLMGDIVLAEPFQTMHLGCAKVLHQQLESVLQQHL